MIPIFVLARRAENIRSIRNRIENRERFDSFELSNARFIELYRLNKYLARNLIEALRPHLHDSGLRRGVKVEQKVLCALRFYATGSYQRCVGEDYNVSVSQTSAHRYIHRVTTAIVNTLGAQYVIFPQTRRERNNLKQLFMERFGFPGTVGAIDCTHIAILKPRVDEQNFINRKGTY